MRRSVLLDEFADVGDLGGKKTNSSPGKTAPPSSSVRTRTDAVNVAVVALTMFLEKDVNPSLGQAQAHNSTRMIFGVNALIKLHYDFPSHGESPSLVYRFSLLSDQGLQLSRCTLRP
jgi:hypothetical protein